MLFRSKEKANLVSTKVDARYNSVRVLRRPLSSFAFCLLPFALSFLRGKSFCRLSSSEWVGWNVEPTVSVLFCCCSVVVLLCVGNTKVRCVRTYVHSRTVPTCVAVVGCWLLRWSLSSLSLSSLSFSSLSLFVVVVVSSRFRSSSSCLASINGVV